MHENAGASTGAVLRITRPLTGSWEGRLGTVLVLVVVAFAVFGQFFAPHDPNAIGVGPPGVGPSESTPLGTDALGRDILSRVMAGGGRILAIAIVGVVVSYLLGLIIGFWSASRGRTVDLVVVRTVDILITLPALLLIFVAVSQFGSSEVMLAALIAVTFLPYIVRVTRGAAQDVLTRDYVQIAFARGESRLWTLTREVLPNCAGPLLADFGQTLTAGILAIATLNYLGIGVHPPDPDWGAMVADGEQTITSAPLATLAPAICIALLCVGLNLVADSVRRTFVREAGSGGSGL